MGAFGIMGGGLVAPALPTIGRAFDVPEGQQGLVLSVYTLAAAISLPFIGYLIDSLGRRKVGIACLLLDGITGISIVFAPNFGVLLLMRFIQGIGIAGLIPIAMTIIGDLFSGERKLQIMGYLAGIISLGAAIIPTLGGALATIDWRLVFLVYGFCLLLALVFFITLPETSPFVRSQAREEKEIQGQNVPTNTEAAPVAKHDSPFDYIKFLLRVLKDRDIRNIMMQPLLQYFVLYGLVTYLPIYLAMHNFPEIFGGLALSLQGISAGVVASRTHLVARYLVWWQQVVLGFIIKGLAFTLLPLWPEGSLWVALSIVIYGLGFGIVSPTIYNRVTTLPPKELSGAVIAIFNTMKYLGMTLSPIVLGLLLNFTHLNVVFFTVAGIATLWGIISLKMADRNSSSVS